MKKAQFYILIVVVTIIIMGDIASMMHESGRINFFSIYYNDLTHVAVNIKETLREIVILSNNTSELTDLANGTSLLFYRMCQEAGYTCNLNYTVYDLGINGTCTIKSRGATVIFTFNFTK